MKIKLYALSISLGLFLFSISYTIVSMTSNAVLQTAFSQLSIIPH